MPLVDGIGDEVVQFVIAVLVVIVAVLAWLSTNARPDRYRAVIQMHARGHHAVTVSIRTRQNSRNHIQNSDIQTAAIDTTDSRTVSSTSANQTENSVIPLQEMDSIVDADMAMINNNRLHFYRRIEGVTPTQSTEDLETTSEASSVDETELEPASRAQIREMDSIVSAMEADLDGTPTTDGAGDVSLTLENNENAADVQKEDKTDDSVTNEAQSEPAPSTTNTTEPNDQRKILIKLKYINDTLKEVEGSLDEPLKDFKCRHFSAELSSMRRVRLIFNGRVLDEGATLAACGLHHRAVVHCLVQPRHARHQPQASERAGPTAGAAGAGGGGAVHELVTEMVNPERYWDLENILMTLVSLALTIVWFFRCEYSNMFTASASVALFGLTVFYSVAIFGLYLSDTFHLDRRAPQATPAAPAPPTAPPADVTAPTVN